MALTTRFGIEIPDVGADADAWGTILNNYFNGLEALVTDKRGDTLTGALTATSFSGVGSGLTALNAENITTGTLANARTTAVSTNAANAIVSRDASGNFSAGTITAALSGNATTATTATSQSGGTVNATTATVSGNFSFNSGYGSAAVAYGCRAWVNFNGTGTVAIRASGNVSSITDNGVGDYTVNFTTAMPDANYSASISAFSTSNASGQYASGNNNTSITTTGLRITNLQRNSDGGGVDSNYLFVSIFR